MLINVDVCITRLEFVLMSAPLLKLLGPLLRLCKVCMLQEFSRVSKNKECQTRQMYTHRHSEKNELLNLATSITKLSKCFHCLYIT